MTRFFSCPRLALVAVLCLTGCTTHTELRYGPYERKLDDRNELVVSTYPAGFPNETSHTPYVSSASESHDEVYFQVQVRGAKAKLGPNPHAKSMKIHSFDYRLEEGDWVRLIKDYPGSFWMQGNPNYDKQNSGSVRYIKGGTVEIRIDFTLNGKRRQLEGAMKANQKSTTVPLFMRKMGI